MWYFASEYNEDVNLNGKTAIVTGGNGGIGYETTKFLFQKGARVLILCRNEDKAQTAINEIIESVTYKNRRHDDLVYKYLDLGDLATVRKCAEEILKEEKHINLLINNAGVLINTNEKTKDGYEMQMGTNYFGPYLLTMLLLPKIISSAPARIVNVSSITHKMPFMGGRLRLNDINFEKGWYHPMSAYAQSKLAQVMFTKELARKLYDAGINDVTTYSLHPGIIASDIGTNLNSFFFGATWLWGLLKKVFFMTPKQGAATILYCALDEKIAHKSGLYYSGLSQDSMDNLANDSKLLENLWNLSKESVKLDSDYFENASKMIS